MSSIQIEYCFHVDSHLSSSVKVTLDAQSLALRIPAEPSPPAWTALDYHPCSSCPLQQTSFNHCPAALSLVPLVDQCGHLVSHQQVDLQVVTPERQISCKTTAQKAVSSLMGLLLATSGCPQTAFLIPMARFHLPLASEEETLYRAASMYLLGQFFIMQQKGTGDFTLEGLKQRYRSLRLVNRGLSERLQLAVTQDSSLNALVLLDLLARFVPFAIEDSLEQFRDLFASYLE